MKGIVFTKYGSPDSIQLKELEKPTPGNDEILVKVHASSVNSWDWDLVQGIPIFNRTMFGFFKPKTGKLGIDIAGTVEAVGKNATRFQQGDEVFGDISACGMGAFSEYVCVAENALTPKPGNMTFQQAAAVPHTATLAWQGLVDKGKIQEGHKVLINGAGGGSGTFGLQIAKHFGAEVTAVDHPAKKDMLLTLGADRFIDYTSEDFAADGPVYDLILDVVTHRSIFDYKRALAPGGCYVMLGGGSYNRVYQTILLGPLISLTGNKKMDVLMHEPNMGLSRVTELLEAEKLVPVIDKTFPLSEVAKALGYFGKGQAKGKIVITMEQE